MIFSFNPYFKEICIPKSRSCDLTEMLIDQHTHLQYTNKKSHTPHLMLPSDYPCVFVMKENPEAHHILFFHFFHEF